MQSFYQVIEPTRHTYYKARPVVLMKQITAADTKLMLLHIPITFTFIRYMSIVYRHLYASSMEHLYVYTVNVFNCQSTET